MGISEALPSITFGRFQVSPLHRELLAGGRPAKLGGRAFDVLMALIETRGAVIDKDALMRRVWPDRVVEENNLQAQISALRAALAPEREIIRTVAGRGYQFTGEIQVPAARPEAPAGEAESPSPVRPTNLKEPATDLIGRDAALREVESLAGTHRLLTLTGAGGIGKTRLALAVARRLRAQYVDGAWMVDLAPLADPAQVAGAVAATLGLELSEGAASAQRVAQALSGRNLLLVLDNCEHLVDAAAMMAEALVRANPAVHVIATSRELLRVEGEWLYPVRPLAVPAANGEDGNPLDYDAVRLFVERTRAAQPHLAVEQRATTVATICRRLDGIPLAIELAASRSAALGIEEVAAHLDDRFQLLTGGRRMALPRHQTLRAMLDWSYELLAGSERMVLRRLAAIAGPFDLSTASRAVASPDIEPSEVVDALSNLVAKSLVAREMVGAGLRYRLLETTRAYALEKLAESGESEMIAANTRGIRAISAV